MAQTTSTELVDGLFSFPGGVNGGVAVIDLPKNQLQSAENCTLRGNFVRPRPPYTKIQVNGSIPSALFQGCCYYKPEIGNESLMASIGGRLFQFSISGQVANVVERTILGDQNPSTNEQAWLWQSERWCIINDGQSAPIFFDGVSARRALQFQSASYTVVTGGVAPLWNQSVTLILDQPYTQGPNYPVFISNGTATDKYTFSPFAGASLVLENITDTAGRVILGGTNIVYDPNFIGMVVAVTGGQAIVGPKTILLDQPYLGAVGDSVHFTPFGGGKVAAVSANSLQITLASSLPPNIGALVYFDTSKGGKFNIAILPSTTSGGFTAPGVGSTVPITSTIQFPTQIAVPTAVFIGNARYVVNSYNNNISNQVIATFVDTVPSTLPIPPLVSPVPVATLNPIVAGNTVTSAFSGNELPPGKMGVYGLGRNWVCLPDGRSFIASDIVGGSSGTALYNFRDAVLRVTENIKLVGGGAFVVPGNIGEISAMQFVATLDVSLGQGPLQILTPELSFSCQAPVDRTAWATVTNPILTESLITNGGLGQDCSVLANGDLLFRSIDGIRSLILGRRDFATWGNVPISREVNEILSQDDPQLLPFASAIVFDNRLLMTTGATQGSLGPYFTNLVALNFDPISTLRGKAPSIYDGVWDGLNVLKLVKGKFSGVERAFAFTYNTASNTIELYEIEYSTVTATAPISWTFASPIIDFGEKDPRKRQLKKLMDGEIYLDQITPLTDANGNNIPLVIKAQFRPDYDSVWHDWVEIKIASDAATYQPRIGLDEPPKTSDDVAQGRPFRVGYAFQVQFTITGNARFMGARFLCNIEQDAKFAPVPGQID